MVFIFVLLSLLNVFFFFRTNWNIYHHFFLEFEVQWLRKYAYTMKNRTSVTTTITILTSANNIMFICILCIRIRIFVHFDSTYTMFCISKFPIDTFSPDRKFDSHVDFKWHSQLLNLRKKTHTRTLTQLQWILYLLI